MARIGRIVIPGLPHHVTHRGDHKEEVFSTIGDYEFYLKLLEKALTEYHVELYAYCLMSNHVHFVDVPSTEDGLSRVMHDVQTAYSLARIIHEQTPG